MQLETDKLNVMELPNSRVDRQGFSRVYDYLYDKGQHDAARRLDRLFPWGEESLWNEWLLEKKNDTGYIGTWPKRFSSYLHKECGIDLSTEIMAEIGEIISRHCQKKDEKFFFEFTKYNDWHKGAFEGGYDSCWWNSYNNARRGLPHAGGYSVLFYKSKEDYKANSQKRGMGRFWLKFLDEDDEMFVIFNAYGLELIKGARLLATLLGLSYTRIELRIEDAFVNSDYGYLIGPPTKITGIKKIRQARMEPKTECPICKKKIGESQIVLPRMYTREVIEMCRPCLADYVKCQTCGGYMDKENKRNVNGYNQCPTCYDKLPECKIHGKTIIATRSVFRKPEEQYCSICVDERKIVAQCNGCGHVVLKFRVIVLPSNTRVYCESGCISKFLEAIK